MSDAEHAPFREEAARNLRSFYAARAEELAPGGRLLVQIYGRDEQVSASHGIYDVVSDALLDRIEEGLLPRAMYEQLLIPVYFRTVDELLAPLSSDPALAEAYRVDEAASREAPVPFNLELERTGDVSEWARRYTGFLRAFTEPIVAQALPAELASPEVVDSIYERVADRLKADPDRYEYHYVSVAILLTRN